MKIVDKRWVYLTAAAMDARDSLRARIRPMLNRATRQTIF